MPRFKYIDDLIAPKPDQCAVKGCTAPGEHRAPVSRDRPGEYQFLCLDHVKEFNKKWDYFQGMSELEILAFQKNAAFGHRPTWHTENGRASYSPNTLRDALRRFMGIEGFAYDGVTHPPLKPKDKLALADLDLSHPVDKDEVKAQYKKLVKRYHPDCNPNNKQAEERFKRITASYHHLIQHYCASI